MSDCYGHTPERARTLRITANALGREAVIIARVQSMRTRGGHVPEPLSFAESQAYLRRVDRVRKRGVTVPQPLCRPAQKNTSTPVECAQAGSFQENQA